MSSRPKRDVHAPPPKDLPSEEATVKRKKSGSRRRLDEMRWCQTVHRELMKKQYESHMFPFYVPVDHVALNIPTYPDVIKHPMDLATIKKKLDGDEYSSCEDFEADVRLMFNNCYTFNPVGSDVFNLAQTSEDVFSRKWAEKPSFSNHRDSVSSAVGGAHAADSGLGASSGSLAARHSISKKKAAEAVVSESSEDSSDEDERRRAVW